MSYLSQREKRVVFAVADEENWYDLEDNDVISVLNNFVSSQNDAMQSLICCKEQDSHKDRRFSNRASLKKNHGNTELGSTAKIR